MSVEVNGYKSSAYFALVDTYLKNLSPEQQAAFKKKIAGKYQFNIKQGQNQQIWTIDLKDQGNVTTQPANKPDLTVSLDDTVFVDLATGKTTGQKAFMQGKLKAKGNLSLAGKLDTLFAEIRKNQASTPASAPTSAKSGAAASSGGSNSNIEIEGFKSSAVFKQIHAWLNSLPADERKKQVGKVKGLFQIDIKGASKVQPWTLDLKNGEGEIYAGPSKSKADAVLTVSDDDFVSMSQGKLTGQKAFMTGKLKVKGQMMLATKLDQVFKNLPSSKL